MRQKVLVCVLFMFYILFVVSGCVSNNIDDGAVDINSAAPSTTVIPEKTDSATDNIVVSDGKSDVDRYVEKEDSEVVDNKSKELSKTSKSSEERKSAKKSKTSKTSGNSKTPSNPLEEDKPVSSNNDLGNEQESSKDNNNSVNDSSKDEQIEDIEDKEENATTPNNQKNETGSSDKGIVLPDDEW